MISPHDTIAAIATPLGEGGLGVIRVSGTQAVAIVSQIFQKSMPSSPAATGGGSMDPRQNHSGTTSLIHFPSHTCHLGFIVSDLLIGQVVVTLFRVRQRY